MRADQTVDRLPGRPPGLDEHRVIRENRLIPLMPLARLNANHDRQLDRRLPGPRNGRTVDLATSREEATMSLTATDMTQVASELLTAFNDADWDRARPLIAPDLAYVENTNRRRVDGADAYLELLQGIRAAFPDFRATIEAT